ncbi:potassium voltage-gated channel protein Shal [Caerostris extrusa]|uniref:Potassium voltage-gated channel protein Shal n=1 Tax=Caerostris extrusa TaxID=172846 RepID=A0AAV4SRH1_CAEEX|nr:potassium voltage-gated channel protein Shal [Caerostris extrusa]
MFMCADVCICSLLQKARMARIRIAKVTSGAAFVSKKKAAEARIAAQESGQDVDEFPEDIFELQHHHLLRCLEKTTVSPPPTLPTSPPHPPTLTPEWIHPCACCFVKRTHVARAHFVTLSMKQAGLASLNKNLSPEVNSKRRACV